MAPRSASHIRETLQGCLAHKETPIPLRPPWDPFVPRPLQNAIVPRPRENAQPPRIPLRPYWTLWFRVSGFGLRKVHAVARRERVLHAHAEALGKQAQAEGLGLGVDGSQGSVTR